MSVTTMWRALVVLSAVLVESAFAIATTDSDNPATNEVRRQLNSADDATVPFNSFDNVGITLQHGLAFIIVLVAAHPLGLLFPKFFKLPLITGYLFVGIVAGPFVSDLLPTPLVTMLSSYMSSLALSFISFQAGQEIYLPELRPQIKSIMILLAVLYVTAMVILTAITFLASGPFFYADFISSCQMGIALMFGSISVLGSPATVMAIKIELNSVGPFTSLMLGATMCAEFVVLLSFSVSRIITSIYCAELDVSVENLFFTLGIVLANVLVGGLVAILTILIFSIPSGPGGHDEHHAGDQQYVAEESPEASMYDSKINLGRDLESNTAAPHQAREQQSTWWTHRTSLYFKGFIWLVLGYTWYISTNTIAEATGAAYGISWEMKFEPLLVLMVGSCIAGHYSSIRHDMHIILDTCAPYIFLPFFVMTGAALKLDKVLETVPLMSLYVVLRYVAIFIACYCGGRFLLKLPPQQYNNLWLTMTPQAGVALGLAAEVDGLSEEAWASEFSTTIISAVVVNQIIGPILCSVGLSRAGETLKDRAKAKEEEDIKGDDDITPGHDNSQYPNTSQRSRKGYPPSLRHMGSMSVITAGSGDPRPLLPFYKVQSAVVIGDDETAYEIALELSLYGARVNVPLLDEELAAKWHAINEKILSRTAKGDLISFKNKLQDPKHDEKKQMRGMAASADVLIFTGNTARTLETVKTMKSLLGAHPPRMIAIVNDPEAAKELRVLDVLTIQPSIAMANVATRMALLEKDLAVSLSNEISTTSNFSTAAYFMRHGDDRASVSSLSDMHLASRRMVLTRHVVNHHSVDYDRLAEALAAENLPMPPPPPRVSMFGTSGVDHDPFTKARSNVPPQYGHFVVEEDVPMMESTSRRGVRR